MKYSTQFKLLLCALSVFFLNGCQSMNSAVGGYFGLDTDLEIQFIVDADINPDELGKPSPLFVRMYELKSKKMIKKADFISIYERDKEVLGADMINVHKLKRLKPGESRNEHFVLDPATQYVALYGEFLEFKQSAFKLVFPVSINNVFRNTVKIRVSGNDLVFAEPVEGSDDSYRQAADQAKSSADKAESASKKAGKYF